MENSLNTENVYSKKTGERKPVNRESMDDNF